MPITLPHDASLNGHHVDAVLRYLLVSTGVVFGVMAAVLILAVVFHSGEHRQARYTHGNRARDRVVTAVVALVVLFGIDAVAVVTTADQLRASFWRYPDGDPRAMRIEVTGQQWAWNFRYPGADDRFNTGDDLVTLNELRVPIDRPVYLQLTSKDVVHSFYLPNFRTKIDVIPGAVTRLWFQPKETGIFEIACSQHCGPWHYKMRGELAVLTEDEFGRWFQRAAADAALRSDSGHVNAGVVSGARAPANGALPDSRGEPTPNSAAPVPNSAAGPADALGARAPTVTGVLTTGDGWDWVPPRD